MCILISRELHLASSNSISSWLSHLLISRGIRSKNSSGNSVMTEWWNTQERRDYIDQKDFRGFTKEYYDNLPFGADCSVERNSSLISLISILSEKLQGPIKIKEKQGYKPKGIVRVYILTLGFIFFIFYSKSKLIFEVYTKYQ